jgi:hypothetical protein
LHGDVDDETEATTMKGRPADHRGFFAYEHDNPPAPFNPGFDPDAEERYRAVAKSMEDDGFYGTHSREECAAEWLRRYESLARGGTPTP